MDDQTNKDSESTTPKKKPKGKYILLIGVLLIGAGCFMAYRPEVKPTVSIKDTAIDWEFPTSDTEKSSLSALWKKGPLVIIWLRHFG